MGKSSFTLHVLGKLLLLTTVSFGVHSVPLPDDTDTSSINGNSQDTESESYIANIKIDKDQITSFILNDNEILADTSGAFSFDLGASSHFVISPLVSLSQDDDKNYITISSDSGERFTAQLVDDGSGPSAKFIFISGQLDQVTINFQPEDSVILLPNSSLTAGIQDSNTRTNKREWSNSGHISVLPSGTRSQLIARDDGMFGVGSMPPVVWQNKRRGRLDILGDVQIGVPHGITENRGRIRVARDARCQMAESTRLLESGQLDIEGVFAGDIVLDGGSVRIIHRDCDWEVDPDLSGKLLRGEEDTPDEQALIDLARGNPDEGGPPGVDNFYFWKDHAGLITGKVYDRDGSTVLFDSDVDDAPSQLARDRGLERVDLAGESNFIEDFNDRSAAFVGPNQRVTINRKGGTIPEGPQDIRAAFYSINGYETYDPDTEYGVTVGVDKTVEVIQDVGDKSTIHYTNDNSWFNGVFIVKSGTADIDEAGAIPGGDVILLNGSSLIWHGGAKDKNNRPTVKLMGKSKLSFDLQPGAVFSVYGPILSDSGEAEIHFDMGEVYIKEDCSGFKGTVFVQNGATFVIRKDGLHRGKMFSGSMQVNGSALVKTTQGLSPLTLTSGSLTFERDNVDQTQESFEINKLTIGKNAEVFANLEGAKINNAVVSGVITVSKNAEFRNLIVDGGTVRLAAGVDRTDFFELTEFGSRLITTDNTIANVTFEALKIRDNHDMFWELDLDPKTNTADYMKVGTMFFTEGSSLVIDKFKLLSAPTAESHVFEILTILNGGKYPNIRVDATEEVAGAFGLYKLYAEGGPGCITLRIPNAAFRNSTPIQLSTIHTSVVPLKNIHQSLVNSASTSHGYVFAESGFKPFPGKFRFWDRTYTGELSTKAMDTKITDAEHGTIFGCDFQASKFNDNTYFVPTVFFNYSTGKAKSDNSTDSKKGRFNKYMVGAKGSVFAGKTLFETIGSFEFIGSDLRELGVKKSKMRSNVFSISTKLSRYCSISNNTDLKPEFTVTGSYAMNGDYKNDSITVKNGNSLKCTLSPGIFVVGNKKKEFYSFGIKCNYEIGKNMKSKFVEDVIEGSKLKKLYGEASCSFKHSFGNGLNAGLEISHQFGGRHGMRTTLSIAKEF
ncbi:MAG: hypothetical protein LBL32_02820 [Holosporales bacterium]|jgi:hypothetical protein|nr:hypothetical protein [Holosporales bacterium]